MIEIDKKLKFFLYTFIFILSYIIIELLIDFTLFKPNMDSFVFIAFLIFLILRFIIFILVLFALYTTYKSNY
ncbi:MAG: hypothetical protein BAJALOKI2v1_450020 [Promethearchaeota archaeon]|nr:MAG: hypothetical protein BAJALOKI2v1_450020 [Candidatus Lokiarchaeota archaeon]